MHVIKRDGTRQPFNREKIERVMFWAVGELKSVSVAAITKIAEASVRDGMTTKELHHIITQAAAQLIGTEPGFHPNYAIVAGRLEMFRARKEAYGQYSYPHLAVWTQKLIDEGIYDKSLLWHFTIDQLNDLNNYIRPERDMMFHYAGAMQMTTKYLIKNRVTGQIYDAPQHAAMLIGMAVLPTRYHGDELIQQIKDFYDVVTTFEGSLPTPIWGGVRTPLRQFSSCVVVEAGDSLPEINAASDVASLYGAARAGLGINPGMIRAEGSPVRGGLAYHTGIVPFIKKIEASVKACSQGGIRGASATLFYPIWHLEFENLVVLKNNKGLELNRARRMDHCFQMNGYLLERLQKGENITLFSPHEVPGLYDAFYADTAKWIEIYEAAEKNTAYRKEVKSAVDLFTHLLLERFETSRIYVMNVDHCNTHSSFIQEIAPIRQSNLCVAPETMILTKRGYQRIADLEGQGVEVWNGEEWSTTTVVKTGENQKLVTVKTSGGQEITCTEYHKFYVQNGYRTSNGYLKIVEKRAHELEAGDKLIKFDLPTISGGEELEHAYDNGFYSGDGCTVKNQHRIYLYNGKRDLKDRFTSVSSWYEQPDQNRMQGHGVGLKKKFFVPMANYTIESRLKWLAGLMDADGTVARNGDNESLQLASTNRKFLAEVQLMLQTLGVSSKVTDGLPAKKQFLPKNDGTGESDWYECKQTWRILISSSALHKLGCMGFETHRLEWIHRKPQRNAEQFIKVTEVVDEGRSDDTYCFTEPKRHMGMFNGLLTGQCVEITLPTKPLQNVDDPNGEVSLCTLAGVNMGKVTSRADIRRVVRVLVNFLDALLDYQDYVVPAARNATMKYRPLGIGITNFANWLAKSGARYSDGSGNNFTHAYMESFQYYLIEASVDLAKKFGAAPGFHATKYSRGLMPIDHYKKAVDELHSESLHMDWDALRAEVLRHGMRNCTLSALMPCESSSQVSNSTNGIEPPRELVSVKGNADMTIAQIVPDYDELKGAYETLWEMPNNEGYLALVAIMQKFVDQSISTNTNYYPDRFKGGMVPLQVIARELLLAYRWGIKTLYYNNVNDGQGVEEVEKGSKSELVEIAEASASESMGCDSGACAL